MTAAALPAILIVGPLPPPSGGMANQTRQLASLLRADGLDVRIVRTNEPYSPAWVEAMRGIRALFRLVPYWLRLRTESARADVVHVMANSGWAWFLFAAPAINVAARRGVPVVVNYRGGLAQEFMNRSSSRVLRTLRRARMVVVPSGFLRDVFAAYGIETTVIPNIIDINVFRPAGHREQADPGQHVVVSRNLEALYGIDVALRAVASLAEEYPRLRLSIAGSGPERASLEALAASLGIATRVCFTGRLEVQAMADLYRSADVALNPSRADNMPNSVLEALACGVPVLSTNVGGVPHVVEHERTAVLVRPDDPTAMAEQLSRLLADGELRARLRRAGLAEVQQYSWPRVRERWLCAYRTLAA